MRAAAVDIAAAVETVELVVIASVAPSPPPGTQPALPKGPLSSGELSLSLSLSLSESLSH